jgi:hypothetical protein
MSVKLAPILPGVIYDDDTRLWFALFKDKAKKALILFDEKARAVVLYQWRREVRYKPANKYKPEVPATPAHWALLGRVDSVPVEEYFSDATAVEIRRHVLIQENALGKAAREPTPCPCGCDEKGAARA